MLLSLGGASPAPCCWEPILALSSSKQHTPPPLLQVLDITDEDLGNLITAGLRNIAAACLELNYPTMASLPHSLVNGYKNVLAIAVETDYTFPLAEKVKAYLADPSAFAVAAAPAAGAAAAPAAAAAPEPEEESEEDMGFSLFD